MLRVWRFEGGLCSLCCILLVARFGLDGCRCSVKCNVVLLSLLVCLVLLEL